MVGVKLYKLACGGCWPKTLFLVFVCTFCIRLLLCYISTVLDVTKKKKNSNNTVIKETDMNEQG